MVGGQLLLESQDVEEAAFFVDLPKSEVNRVKTPIEIDVYSNGKMLQRVKTNFLGPNPFRKKHHEKDQHLKADEDEHDD